MTAWIVAARRSAVAPRGGAFARLSIEELAAPVARACLADAGLHAVDELILANALGAGGNPARRVALATGLPVAGLSVDRQCAGGLDAIGLAAALVESGRAEAVLAGGAESFSRRPLRFATDPDGGPPVPYDQAPFTPWPDRDPGMIGAAAALAERLGLSRQAQEAYAAASHARALAGGDWPEIVALAGLARDTFPRQLSASFLPRLAPLSGSVTAATAAVEADAAAFCLVVSDRVAVAAGRALRILGCATAGADPMEPGLSAIPPMRAVLDRAGLTRRDIAQTELMEAFAVQAMATIDALGLDPARVNPRGGGLARGHPIGASGAVLAVRLFHDLRAGYGLAGIAGAGGVGAALLVQARDRTEAGRIRASAAVMTPASTALITSPGK